MSSDVSSPASLSSESSPKAALGAGERALRMCKGLGPALGILLAALYSQLVLCRAEHARASEGQWRAAADFVREHRGEPGTSLIVFAPSWIDPIGREYLGDQMTIDMAARMDSARFASIWQVSLGDERAPETKGLSKDESAHFGPLQVRRYRQSPVAMTYDFTETWRSSVSSGDMQGRPSLSLEEVGFEPHRCIKLVPQPGKTASLRFTDVPLGTRIVGYVGLADVFTRRDVRDPGELELFVNDTSLVKVRAGVDSGWVRFEAATTPGVAKVEFQLSAIGANARDRRICFAAEARQ